MVSNYIHFPLFSDYGKVWYSKMNFSSKWFQTCLSWFLRLTYSNVLFEKRQLHYFLSTLKLFWAGIILSCNTYVKQRRAQNWFNCLEYLDPRPILTHEICITDILIESPCIFDNFIFGYNPDDSTSKDFILEWHWEFHTILRFFRLFHIIKTRVEFQSQESRDFVT